MQARVARFRQARSGSPATACMTRSRGFLQLQVPLFIEPYLATDAAGRCLGGFGVQYDERRLDRQGRRLRERAARIERDANLIHWRGAHLVVVEICDRRQVFVLRFKRKTTV